MEDKKARQAKMARAYHHAMIRLRDKHRDEFREILFQVYEDLGMTVRLRRTQEEIRQDQIRKARELLDTVDNSGV